ncbi:MAG: helix-turn-helix domain-containing protein [Pseudonocardiales bacterium]|nr:helix-turn-helix domain-containing protein [Pseudonocardiales bacterium]
MYRVRDVAKHFDVSTTTIYRAIESGQLAALKIGTGQGALRITGAAVAAYAKACAHATNDPLMTGTASASGQDSTVTSAGARRARAAPPRAHRR